MKTQKLDFTYSLGYLTVVTGRIFSGTFGRRIADAGLDATMEQWSILRVLLNEDGCTQDVILGISRYEKSTLSRILEGLEKKGLVERKRGATDARRKEVFLTQKGYDIGVAGTEIVLDSLAKLYEGIDPAQLDQCRNMLALMQTRLLDMWHREDV